MNPEPDLIKLRKLYPELSEEELKDAYYRMDRYLQIVLRVFKDLEEDPAAMAAYKLELKVSRWEAWARERRSCSLSSWYPYPLPVGRSLRSSCSLS